MLTLVDPASRPIHLSDRVVVPTPSMKTVACGVGVVQDTDGEMGKGDGRGDGTVCRRETGGGTAL